MRALATAFLRTPTPAFAVLRAFVLGSLVALSFFALENLNKELRLSLSVWTEGRSPLQIYHAFRDQTFDERQVVTRSALNGGWQPHVVEFRGYRDVTLFRIDPMTARGALQLGPVVLTGRWSEVTLRGSDLERALSAWNDLRVTSVDRETLRLEATGPDPHFNLVVPDTLFDPPLARLTAAAALLGAMAGLAWLTLEIVAAFLRRFFPFVYVRARSALMFGWVLPVLVCAGLSYHASDNITDGPVLGDAIQNLLIARNVYQHNTFSIDNSALYARPSNFREPLPPLVVGLYLKALLPAGQHPSFAQLRAGDKTRFVKLSNLIWVFAGLVGVWLLMIRLTRHGVAGLAATLLAYLYFFHAPAYIDSLYTELPTATLLIWCTYALFRAVRKLQARYFAAAGVLMGLLALCKASFFYIGWAALLLLVLVMLFSRRDPKATRWQVLRWGAVAGLCMSLTLAPWMLRNQLQFGYSQVSDRGGLILAGRATLNHMSDEEVLGLLYEKSPQLYRRLVAGTRFAEKPGDFERGGRWQRLNRGVSSFFESDRRAAYEGQPDGVVSFHFKAGAEARRRLNALRAQGVPHAEQVLDQAMKREAMAMIQADPWRHIWMSGPFLWHGFWSFQKFEIPLIDPDLQEVLVESLNLTAGAALLAAFVFGLFAQRPRLIALTVMPVGLLLFYAFLTHNIPRYSTPAHPLMLVVLVVAAHRSLAWARHRVGRLGLLSAPWGRALRRRAPLVRG